MNSEKSGVEKEANVAKGTIVNNNKLTIRTAKKVSASEKPRLYKKVQKALESIKSSFSEDIIEARYE